MKKRVVLGKTGQVRESTDYLVSSLSETRAGPRALLALGRGHWSIENRLFHVLDNSFGEDRQVVQAHRSGAVLSLLRAAALNLLCGRSPLWTDQEPLTGRAQRVSACPLDVLLTRTGP